MFLPYPEGMHDLSKWISQDLCETSLEDFISNSSKQLLSNTLLQIQKSFFFICYSVSLSQYLLWSSLPGSSKDH